MGNSDGTKQGEDVSLGGIPSPLESGRAVLVLHEALSLVWTTDLRDSSKI